VRRKLVPFWGKVRKFDDGCWLWLGHRDRGGYGSASYQGKTMGAHRVAYLTEVGPIPEGLWVLHKCDNPPCVRPDHLFLGTVADNNADAIAKGRQARRRGNSHPSLTTLQVRAIRRIAERKLIPLSDLAAAVGVSRYIAERIVSGEPWGDAPLVKIVEPEPYHARGAYRRGRLSSNAKLTEDAVRDMRTRYATGDVTTVELAGEYGISGATVSRVINRLAWQHVE
jgi:DNA-binding MarR family transcriptional regulator